MERLPRKFLLESAASRSGHYGCNGNGIKNCLTQTGAIGVLDTGDRAALFIFFGFLLASRTPALTW